MEHLIFDPGNSDGTTSAFRATILRQDWKGIDNLIDFVPPKTPWLGFNHDAIPLDSFGDYLDAAGFNQSELWNANFRESHRAFREVSATEIGRRTVAFLQSWLYYGLVECVVKKKIEVSYLMRRDVDGQDYLYSRNLHFCLQMRVFDINLSPPSSKPKVNMDIQLDLRAVKNWISRFTVWSHPSFRPKLENRYPGFMIQLENIIPAIVRLAEVIERTRLCVLRDAPTLGTLAWHYPYEVADRRRLKLRDLGWCPFQIKLLEDTLNQSTIDWVICLNMKQDPTGHETCSVELCARNNVDSSTYEQLHVRDDCRCPKLRPNLDQVLKILKDDEIPVICFEVLEGEPRLTVSANPKTRPGDYIAISHVWADGLGGCTEKGLTLCQVERLSKLCKSLINIPHHNRFWIDSLCIPRSDDEAYFKALVGIRDVYINASAVVVVDSTIEECTLSSTTEKLYIHIYLSAWMQRMWTYEEAVLARELIFVLKDGFHTYRVDTLPSMRRTVCVVWQSLAAQLYRLRADQKHLNIGHIHQAFRYRLTNAGQEEFLSVSGMLNLDTESLIKSKGEERVKKFWVMLKWIPFNVPFLDGPKLDNVGFRWAPRTMMFPTQTKMDTEVEGEKSECTEAGLIGIYLMVVFDTPLKGSAGDSRSIFYVWVKGNDDCNTPADSFLALLRLYCVQSWPAMPASHEFDTIMLATELKLIPKAGELVAGAAFCRQKRGDGFDSGSERLQTFRYVGRLLVERLQNGELSSTAGTLMFEGSSKVTIDTEGIWSTRKVCIT